MPLKNDWTNGDLFTPAAANDMANVVNAFGDRAVYVSTTGNNANAGTVSAPYATIPYAVSQLTAGDTLYILEGNYSQAGTGAVFASSGTPARPITVQGVGDVVIEGPNTVTYAGQVVASNFSPAFDTNGKSFINFRDFTVENVRAAVTVNTGSSYVTIDGVDTDRCHYGVLIDGAKHVTVGNATITNSRYGIRTDATTVTPTDLLFHDIDVSGSKDVFSGWETGYRNGDGFIFEAGDRIVVRDCKTHDNWDAGLDIKADDVTVERVESYGNRHNGVKLWGDGIVFRNCVIRDTEATLDDPETADGNGLNMRTGSTTMINTTISNSYWADIKMGTDISGSSPPALTLRNCIVARNTASVTLGGVSSRCLLYISAGGSLTETNTVWHDPVRGNAGTVNGVTYTVHASSLFTSPAFVNHTAGNLRLTASSPAIGLGSLSYDAGITDLDGNPRTVNSTRDSGAYESAARIDGQVFGGTADITVIAPATNAATSKTTPVNADSLPLVDSESSNVLKKLTWANLTAGIKAYYDGVTSILTSKSISLGSNTLTGTTAQFNTALSDGDFATLAGTETLSGKTLTGTRETVHAITDGAAFEIDPRNGGIQTVTLGASRTPKATNFAAGFSMLLMVAPTANSITWTDATLNPVWVGGSPPALSTTQQTVISLWEVGTTIYGALIGYA